MLEHSLGVWLFILDQDGVMVRHAGIIMGHLGSSLGFLGTEGDLLSVLQKLGVALKAFELNLVILSWAGQLSKLDGNVV